MSTRITLSHNDFFHLYKEVFNDRDIFLTLTQKNTKIGDIHVCLSPEDFMLIYSGMHAKIQEIYQKAQEKEEEIEKSITDQVCKRIEKKGAYALMGSYVYGDESDPKEEQIKRGLEFFTKIKKSNIEIVENIRHKTMEDGVYDRVFSAIFENRDNIKREINAKLSMAVLKLYDWTFKFRPNIFEEKMNSISHIRRINLDEMSLNELEKIKAQVEEFSYKVDLIEDNSTPTFFDLRDKF